MKNYYRWLLEKSTRIPHFIVRKVKTFKTRTFLRKLSPAQIFPQPWQIHIGTSTICNADCVFCAYQYTTPSERNLMSDEVFNKIVEEIVRYQVRSVSITPIVGDPLVDRKLPQRIEMLKKSGVMHVGLSTNGISINKMGAGNLIRSGISQITVSTVGFDADEFLRIYRSSHYKEVISGIENLMHEKKKQGSQCEIGVSVISERSKKEVLSTPDAVRLIRLGVPITFPPIVDDWNGQIAAKDLPPGLRAKMGKEKPKNEPCQFLFSGPNIRPDGSAVACACRDLFKSEELNLGKIDEGFQEMHQRSLKIIENWNVGNIPKLCQDCKIYNGIWHSEIVINKHFPRNPLKERVPQEVDR